MKKNNKDVNNALEHLLKKYQIHVPGNIHLYKDLSSKELCMEPGYEFLENWKEKYEVPLLMWRVKRKFIELKKIVEDRVIEDASLFRISSIASNDKWTLDALLYREIDVCEFVSNGKIITIQAIVDSNHSANVILKMDNGILCSVEVNVQLPSKDFLIDRHEIIGRRGVASDLSVDTQIPQSSVYGFTKNREFKYTDVDAELFGFDEEQINRIRAAFTLLKYPNIIIEWKQQHKHLTNLVKAVFNSDKKQIKIDLTKDTIHEAN